MAVVTTYDGLLTRIGNGYWRVFPFDSVTKTQCSTSAPNSSFGVMQKMFGQYTIPTLESGVTAYLPTKVMLGSKDNAGVFFLCRMTNLGSLNLGTNTFTDANAMPTVTEMNSSQQRAGPVFAEVTTARDGNAAAFNITYKDQDNNTAETGGNVTVTTNAAVGQGCWCALNSPDWGVRDITAAARASGTGTGVLKFWGLEPIVQLLSPGSGKGSVDDMVMQTLNIFPLSAGDVIGAFNMTTTAQTGSINGMVYFVGDS